MRNCTQCHYQQQEIKDTCYDCEATELHPKGTHFVPIMDDGTAAASPHYNSLGVQPIELMEDILTYEEFKGFLKGNMIKYAFRAGKKDPMEKDINKYKQYRDWYDICCDGLRVSATIKK